MSAGNPVLLVTGGSRGIGASVCRLAASEGWQVAVNYASNADAAEAVVSEIRANGGSAVAIEGDVGTELGLAAIFSALDATFGRLDGMVNNAGITGLLQRLDEISVERLERMFAVNAIGSIRCAQEAVRRMSTRHGGKGGSIVNVSSMAAVIGGAGQYVDYAATKGAIESFTVGLAREVAAEGIRVNAVRPGIIDTDIHIASGTPDRAREMASSIPMQRPGTADEVAKAILYLISDAASYVTGAVLNVSGGR
ncbi:SDR family oxidoreductase [Sinorhizobium sp. BG8]|uniref:SDR family oxidoreductase n=1 Tax=Sinorhizobium sp. BG8 TaxID=2613773 RepID=UPI00193CA3D7|nr:SDR family oxidoreductase [Sinorhizobium sp. BG8]QRM53431.1 SDR family oxidoreductase [Sinorhizobium sp. BG8]